MGGGLMSAPPPKADISQTGFCADYDYDYGSTTTQNPWASRVNCMISKNAHRRGSHHDDGFWIR